MSILCNDILIISDDENVGHCNSCDSDFIYMPDETWFDEHGYSYSTKLTKCPECGKIVILKHIEDYSLKVNKDYRYFY